MIVQRLFLIVVIVSFAVTKAFAQCQRVEGFEKQQFSTATEIFEGEVIAQNSFFGSDGNIYTNNSIEVYRVFKGNIDNEMSVITAGGIVGNTMQVVTPSTTVSVNDYGLFIGSSFPNGKKVDVFYAIDEQTNHVYGTQIASSREALYDAVARAIGSTHIELRRIPVHQKPVDKTAVQIASVQPQCVTAGTQTLITISGQGFGAEQGSGHVAFSNANDGGQSFVTLQPGPHYVSWSDSEIQLYVPSASLFNTTVAGTGNLEVRNNAGQTVLSNQELHIDFAKSEVVYNERLNNTTLVAPQNGGYDYQPNQALYNLLGGTQQLDKNFEKWSCNTGVNFRLVDEVNDLSNWEVDGVNLIGLSAPGQLPLNLLGRTVTTFSGCGSADNLQWNLIEIDILLNADIDWYVGGDTPPADMFDLPTSILHELGHAHLLQHNNDPNSPMYFQLLIGSSRRQLSTVADISGGNYVVEEASQVQSTCNEDYHQPHNTSDCNLSLINSVDENAEVQFSVYPNPFSEAILIDLNSTDASHISLIDQLGRVIQRITPNSPSVQSNTQELSAGIYIVQVQTENKVYSKQLVKN